MAHPDIALLNAVYPDVPAVVLPVDGGGTAQFDDTTDANATASDIANGKTAYVNNALITGTFKPNIVQGTFTTVNSRDSNGTVSIPYTGSGYPIALIVYVENGPYNSSSSGNSTWYNAKTRYDVGVYQMIKSRTNGIPTYETSLATNYGTVSVIYKDSTTSSTTYTRTSSMTANTFTTSSTNATDGVLCVRFKGNGTTLSYYTGNLTSSTRGLMPNLPYQYIAVYSS